MKVTIDSSEPLSDALRLVGALYNVSLARVDEDPAAVNAKTARVSRRSSANGNGSGRKTAKKPTTRTGANNRAARKRGASPTASTSEIRQWAKDTGQAVSSRGTLPAAVKAAYAAAHTGS